MSSARRFAIAAVALILAGCGKSSSSSDGPPPGPGPVVATAPIITGPPTSLPQAFLGVPITPVTFTATGTGPITWSVTAGTLTSGLTLSTGGVLTGTPTAPGAFSFTVTATNAAGTDLEVFNHQVETNLTESEPNNDAGAADPIAFGARATGTITADDVDFWYFPATAGQIVRAELFAIRADFASWDGNANRPRMQLIGPNGTDYLVGHEFDNGGTAGWQWGDHDLDIPMYRIPVDGIYFVRIDSYFQATAGGDYMLLLTDVAPGSIQAESEANDDATSANAITPGLVRAVKADDNDDWFAFTIAEATIVYFEVTGYRNGVFGAGGVADDDYIDLTIELIDADQSFVRATSYQVFFSDPAINYHLTTPGTYYVRVTEAAGGTDGDGDYFLTYTATPVGSFTEAETNEDVATATPINIGDVVTGDINGGDTDFFSFTGNAGDIVRLFWFEAGASETAFDFLQVNFMIDDFTFMQRAISFTGVNGMACARAILPATGTFYIRITPDGGFTPYAFQLTLFKNSILETEGNDTFGTANAIPGSGRISGAIGSSGDEDHFSFTALAGESVILSVHAGPGSSSNGFPSHTRYTTLAAALLPTLEVLDSTGAVIGTTPYMATMFSGESVTNGVATSEIVLTAPSAGTYYIRVTASDGSGSLDHLYLLEKR